uniref:phospholipase A2 group XV-like n=1 Tax=Styela clava TaxID=7725 RepID=UPI00193A8D00|nr:phospholipase A2 group XV-like [Styela clava]
METTKIFTFFISFILILGNTAATSEEKLDRKLHFNTFDKNDYKKIASNINAGEVQRKPIVLVPGVLGSRLQAKLNLSYSPGWLCEKIRDWFDIWLNIEELTPFYVNCWVYDISMRYDNRTKKVANQEGVKTRILDFGKTEDFEYLDSDHYAPGSPYFTELVESLIKFGYKRGDDLKGAPYDWRITPSQSTGFLQNLTKLIENNYYEHFNRKVVLIGHSMGNMFTYYMLRTKPQEWKDKFIDSFISISSPYIGSVKAVKAITSGETEGHDFALPKLKLRTATRTFSSSYFLLPRPKFWPKDKLHVVDTLIKNYTVFEYKALFERIGCKNCYEIWDKYGTELGDMGPPNVPVHCVYSSQIPTPELLIYDPDLFPDGTPVLKTGDGDGTVNVFSSSYCLKWKKSQKQPVYEVYLPGNTHVEILNNATLHNYIKKVATLNQGAKLDRFDTL